MNVTASPPFAEREAELHAIAERITGYADFGDAYYRQGLRVLLKALDADPTFTPMGREVAFGTILDTLCARLYTQEGWKRHTQCLDIPIQRPLIITGIPRTGTTALHKLLSIDPQFQGLEHWLTATPMVRPPRCTWHSIPQYQACESALEAFFALAPEMRKAHDIAADEVDECLEILRQEFVSNRFASGIFVPSYDSWFRRQNERPAYRRFANVLRLIGTNEPQKRWLLKNPGHLAQLECLFGEFPDACVVQTHRDPLEAIPSLCSTLLMARRMFEGAAAQPAVIGPRECDYWSTALESAVQPRARRSDQFYDVDYRDLHADPLGTVRHIYDHFGIVLSQEVEARMKSWIADSPTRKHGAHHYDRQQFGVTEVEIRERFAAYRTHQHFD
jgi:hypothetical protein